MERGGAGLFYIDTGVREVPNQGKKPGQGNVPPKIWILTDAKRPEDTDPNYTPAEHLKVAKWENAFETTPVLALKQDFISLDPDRFIVRVEDHATGDAFPKQVVDIEIKLKTSSDHEITETLVETGAGTGIFQSKSMILTSVRVDDELTIDGIADNDSGDRTFFVKLEDTVKVSYEGQNGETVTSTADVPIKKFLDLRIHDLLAAFPVPILAGGVSTVPLPSATAAAVHAQVDRANEIYAQIGIRVHVGNWVNGNPESLPPPNGVNLSDGFNFWDPRIKGGSRANRSAVNNPETWFTKEEWALLQAKNVRQEGDPHIEVYYVNRLDRGDNPLVTLPAGTTLGYADVQKRIKQRCG